MPGQRRVCALAELQQRGGVRAAAQARRSEQWLLRHATRSGFLLLQSLALRAAAALRQAAGGWPTSTCGMGGRPKSREPLGSGLVPSHWLPQAPAGERARQAIERCGRRACRGAARWGPDGAVAAAARGTAKDGARATGVPGAHRIARGPRRGAARGAGRLTSGSSGLGSVSSELMDSSTFEIVSAGDHWSLRMSRQMLPWLFTLGWYTLVWKLTLGGLKG